MALRQTCQPLVKENLETHEKKSGDCIKNSEILFFPDQTPFSSRALDTNLIPRASFPFQNGGQKTDDKLLNTSKTRSSMQKSSNNSVFSLLVYHLMALVFLKNIPLLFKNLFSERFSPKNREIGSLVVRP